MTPEIKRRLAAIASRWNDIEERMKELETLRGETLSAAINELRYTGRKIADVLSLATSEDPPTEKTLTTINEYLIVAENYLNNADHDVTDAAILFVGVRVKRVVERYGKQKVERCVPKFEELHKFLEEGFKVVSESRGRRGQRADIYKELAATCVPRLVELHKLITSHSELLLPDEQVRRGLQLVSVMAIIGALAGIGTFSFNVIAWYLAPDVPTLLQIEQIVRDAVKEPGAPLKLGPLPEDLPS